MRIASRNELKDQQGVSNYLQEMAQTIERMSNERVSANQRPTDDRQVVKLNPDGSLPPDVVEKFRTQINTNNAAYPMNNWEAERDPDPDIDNATMGYLPGSHWCNIIATPLPSVWICVISNEITAAWRQIDRP